MVDTVEVALDVQFQTPEMAACEFLGACDGRPLPLSLSAGKAVIDEAAFQIISADIHDGMVDDTLADGRCVYDSLLRFEYLEGVVMPEGIVPGDEGATDFLEIIGEFRAIGGNIRAECLATLNLPEGDLQILQVTDVLVDVPQALQVVCFSSTDASSFATPSLGGGLCLARAVRSASSIRLP